MEHRLKNKFISGAVTILAALALGSARLDAATFTASLDSYSIVVGETVNLTLTIEDGSPSEISGLPQMDGLTVASAVSQGMRSSTGSDGKTTRETTYTVALAATRTGEFVIPPFRAKVNGQTMSTSPLKLKVVAEDTSAPPPEYADQPVFLWLVPLKERLFVGEVFTLEMRLYVRSDIRRVGNIETPLAGDGFTFGKRVDGRQVQRRIGNNVFTMVPFFIALTPLKTGALTLSLADGSLIINPHDPFDLSGFFGGRNRNEFRFRSNRLP